MAYLNLAAIRECTEAEGPGKRFAIWVQGCNRRCPGCCNPQMQEIELKNVVASADLCNLIMKSKEVNGIEGVTFLGGEPMLQAEGYAEVAEWARENGLTVMAFTGFLHEELLRMGNPHVDRLLKTIDVLVDGPFIQEKYDSDRDWVGSTNQRVIFLSDAYKPGMEFEKKEHQMELLISEDSLLMNGWPFMTQDDFKE